MLSDKNTSLQFLAITNGTNLSPFKENMIKSIFMIAKRFEVLTTAVTLKVLDLQQDKAGFTSSLESYFSEGIHIYDREVAVVDYL